MKKYLISLATFFAFTCAFGESQPKENEKEFIKENMEFAAKQYRVMLDAQKGNKGIPRTITGKGKTACVSIYDWTSGFFPGSLWYISDFLGDKELQGAALDYTTRLTPAQKFTGNHDIGFIMYCSFGNANRFAPQAGYEDILKESARSLSTRFRPKAGVIQSWNFFRSWHGDKTYDFPVIIDNMMNLELLFHVSKASGDNSFRDIAISHAEKTMKNQVRKDHSCFHIIYYDKNTGAPIKGETSQGYSDNSAWSRGQAWGIYGFTMVYRWTQDKRFLKTAQKMADFYLDHPNLPSDKVAWWDFNAYQKGYTPGVRSNANNVVMNYRDASAAACVASALMELSTYSKGAKSEKYLEGGKQILHSLASPAYRANLGENANFIIKHCVGAIPHNNEIDVPLNYADYYFVEALHRYNKLLNNQPLVLE